MSSVNVRAGDRVGRGMVLGYSGRSGNLGTKEYDANGNFTGYYERNKKLTPHVHIQVFKGGKWIDPAEVMPDYASRNFDKDTGKLKERPLDCPEMWGSLFPELNLEQERLRMRHLKEIVGG